MSDHERVSELFLRACELPPAERESFLHRECRGDDSLRREVQEMLEEDSRDGGTVGMMGLVGAAAAAVVGARTSDPHRIGPYRILERIGEGGMGIVYRAEQEEPIRRVVALKVIRDAFHSDAVLARFDAERQTLARMEHPNIAKVLDAGSTGDGQPYFVMELVDGKPVLGYCRARSLDIRSRLLIFRDICRAVRHAHRRGIIHRDLKPSNVLVTEIGGQPIPKVIDFSIAKVLEGVESDPALRTRTGQVVGTLAYMSPEQARGEIARVDTRSDVYSLGVLLFEILVERLPYEVSDLPLPEAVLRISETPPMRLRSADTITGGIDPDLETIIEKCLAKEPDRRYGSAAELTEDLDRFLDHRPILARPATTLYLARKLIGRHRAATTLAVVVAGFVLLFAVTMAIQFGVQRRERLRAEAEASKARQVTSFLSGMLASAHPYQGGKDLTVREVVQKAAQKAEEELADQPEVLGEVERTVGKSYIGLGVPQEGLIHLERALELKIEALGPDDLEVARAHNDLAGCLAQLGRNVESESHVERALEIRRKLPGEESAELAQSLIQLSDIRYGQSRFEEALSLADEAVAVRRRLPEEQGLTYALMSRGVILIQMGRLQEADRVLNEAAAVQLRISTDRHPLYMAVRSEIAFNFDRQGRREEALPLYEEVLRNRLEVLGADHPLVALSHNNLASALVREGRCLEAGPHLNEALRIWRTRFGEIHRSVAMALKNKGTQLQCSGNYAEAREVYASALAIVDDGINFDSQQYVDLLRQMGSVSARLSHLGEAEDWLRRALNELEDGDGLDQAASRWPLHEMGAVLILQHRPADAEGFLREALRLLKSNRNPVGGEIHTNALGRCLAALGQRVEGEVLMQESRPDLFARATDLDPRRHELQATAEYFESGGNTGLAAEYRAALDRLTRTLGSGGSLAAVAANSGTDQSR